MLVFGKALDLGKTFNIRTHQLGRNYTSHGFTTKISINLDLQS